MNLKLETFGELRNTDRDLTAFACRHGLPPGERPGGSSRTLGEPWSERPHLLRALGQKVALEEADQGGQIVVGQLTVKRNHSSVLRQEAEQVRRLGLFDHPGHPLGRSPGEQSRASSTPPWVNPGTTWQRPHSLTNDLSPGWPMTLGSTTHSAGVVSGDTLANEATKSATSSSSCAESSEMVFHRAMPWQPGTWPK